MSILAAHTSRSAFSLPLFLVPACATSGTATPTLTTVRFVSSKVRREKQKNRKVRDASLGRGVSALRSTGHRTRLSVDKFPLPQPVKDLSPRLAEFQVNENHGLWGFFGASKESLLPAAEEGTFGRAWTTDELDRKSFDDLWRLHWTCVKEANQVATRANEARRLRVGYSHQEADSRIKEIKRTMSRIRLVLLKRHYMKAEARILLQKKALIEVFPDAEAAIHLERGIAEEISEPVIHEIGSQLERDHLDKPQGHEPGMDIGVKSDKPMQKYRGVRQ